MKTRLVLRLLLGLGSISAMAHPVSYKDAFGIMSYNSQRMNEFLLTYSFSPRFAVAGTYLRDSNSEFYIPRLNFLVKRWNNHDSQANFYLSAGAGTEKYGIKTYGAQLGEAVLDWEDRQYYTYIDHIYIRRDNAVNPLIPLGDYNHTKLRLGYAPFLAEYDELNIWLVAQFEKHNDERQINATQFLRFYRKNVLWEIGAGFDGSVAFNFMVHL